LPIATAWQPFSKRKTVTVIIGANPLSGCATYAEEINVDIEPMPGAALQTYIAGASDPAELIERAKVVARPAGTRVR
jgi:hypothetical protein